MALTLTGTPTITDTYSIGSLMLMTPQSVREKIRAGLAYGLKYNLTKSTGYFNDIGEVNVEPKSFALRKNFPSIDVIWDSEKYTNGVSGGNTLGAYEKISTLFIDVWFQENDILDRVLQRETIVSDLEKYFGINYRLPQADNSNSGAFTCILESNKIFGMQENKSQGGISLVLKVYYRIDISNPSLAC